jgi:hypothetical protein
MARRRTSGKIHNRLPVPPRNRRGGTISSIPIFGGSMADSRNMHKADFVTSLVLLAFGVTTIVLSVTMPRLEHRGINPYTIPGLVPGLLGAAIVIMGAVLFLRSVYNRGYSFRISRQRLSEIIAVPQVQRVAATLLICLIYALGLIGRLWYPASTLIFVLAFIVVFEYQREQPLRGQSRRIVTAGIEALLTAAVVSAVFRYLFLVRLP